MAIYQICFRLLSCPDMETQLIINKTYQMFAPIGISEICWDIYLKAKGIYKIEYWVVNDMGTEIFRKITEVVSSGFISPHPPKDADFIEPVLPDSKKVVVIKDGIKVVFKKMDGYMGESFDWVDLDLKGLIIGKVAGKRQTYFIDIQSGSWLSKKLNNERCIVEIETETLKKIFYRSYLLTSDKGELKNNLPNCYKHVIANPGTKKGIFCFGIKRAGLFTIEI